MRKMTCPDQFGVSIRHLGICMRFDTHQTPYKRDGGPSAEPMRHLEGVVVTRACLRICEGDHADQECKDDVREDHCGNGDLRQMLVRGQYLSAFVCTYVVFSEELASCLRGEEDKPYCPADCSAGVN